MVNLVAEADECYQFVNWSGDVGTVADPNSATTTITMDGPMSVTANSLLSYDLATDSTEGGDVVDPGEDTFAYDCGTVVNLVAEAEAGYRFVGWTGDVATIANVTAASTTITMEGNYGVTANFIARYTNSPIRWSEDVSVAQLTDPHLTLVMDKPRTILADFEPAPKEAS